MSETDRLVKIAPIRLRRRTSRLTRSTLKLVGTASAPPGVSSVWMLMAPTLKSPTLPVRRPPPRIGTVRPWSRPIRRLKKRVGASPLPKKPDAPMLRRAAPPPPAPGARPKSKMPWLSRKNSRFSGKNRLNRVRLICCSSTSTCAKSVFQVKSAVRFSVSPYLTSPPACPAPSFETGGTAVRSVASEPIT